jgi:hypothetical protein
VKITISLGPRDEYGCRDVGFDIKPGGDMRLLSSTYHAGALYLREEHAEMIVRSLEGASGGFVGDVEVIHL